MIRPFVKEFIEKFITEIEQHNWRRITDRWYDYALFHSLEYEDAMFDQFVAIMKHVVGVDFLEESKVARYDELYFELTEIVQDHINDKFAPGRERYNKTIYTDQLVTTLGFSIEELESICDAVVSDLGFTYDEEYYYIGEEE